MGKIVIVFFFLWWYFIGKYVDWSDWESTHSLKFGVKARHRRPFFAHTIFIAERFAPPCGQYLLLRQEGEFSVATQRSMRRTKTASRIRKLRFYQLSAGWICKMEAKEKDVVHQDAIHVEMIRKEQRQQKLNVEFSINPHRKCTSTQLLQNCSMYIRYLACR